MTRRGGQRLRLDERVAARPHVWATAFGPKLTDSERRPEPAFVVFVSRKRPRGKLRSDEMVPKTVVRRGRRLLTDVEELKPLRYEQGWPDLVAPLPPKALAVTDGAKLGTLSCFAELAGRAVGVSCAHVLGGPDRNAVTPDAIQVYAPGTRNWVSVGRSQVAVYRNGQGTPTDFGRLDAGAFSIEDASLVRHARERPVLDVYTPSTLESLKGRPVRGLGVRAGECQGFVRGVAFASQVSGVFIDVVVRSPRGEGMTSPGDSGLIWRLADGAGVAVHMLGEDRGSERSPVSFCCLLSRVVTHLGVSELRA